jgi:Domain of unknown function (DUF4158)
VKVGAAVFELYDDWSGRAVERHRVQIRGVFGFRDFSRGDEDKLADWLAAEVCPVELRDEQLREALLVRCRAERIEPPRRVDRIVAIVSRSARVDIGKAIFEATVRAGWSGQEDPPWGAYARHDDTAALLALRDWLVAEGVTVVGWSRPGCFGSRSSKATVNEQDRDDAHGREQRVLPAVVVILSPAAATASRTRGCRLLPSVVLIGAPPGSSATPPSSARPAREPRSGRGRCGRAGCWRGPAPNRERPGGRCTAGSAD